MACKFNTSVISYKVITNKLRWATLPLIYKNTKAPVFTEALNTSIFGMTNDVLLSYEHIDFIFHDFNKAL
jgi:hypothetical protein